MAELDRLIDITEKAIHSKSQFIEDIKYPHMFLTSLKEMRDVIGMEDIKNSISNQILHLLSIKNIKKDINSPPPMLNTVLYGNAGIGKSLIGTKLAKIWYAMGFIHGAKSNAEEAASMMTTFGSWLQDPMMIYIIVLCCILIYRVFEFIYSSIKKTAYGKYAPYIFLAGLTMIIGISVIIYIKNNLAFKKKLEEGIVKDSDVITIVSREDFINKYLGGTDKQTKALLQANTGKVLFIDEAYSLCNGEHDPYGMEALTTLNRYLSEHPERLFVIMAGYKDLIKENIFDAQPGLPSRFMWHFECSSYSASELCQIFLLKVKKDGWSFRKKDLSQLETLFEKNIDVFTAYGRDVQRLLFFSQLEFSKMNITMGEQHKSVKLNIECVTRGLETLVKNNKDDSKDKKPKKNTKRRNNKSYDKQFKDLLDNLMSKDDVDANRDTKINNEDQLHKNTKIDNNAEPLDVNKNTKIDDVDQNSNTLDTLEENLESSSKHSNTLYVDKNSFRSNISDMSDGSDDEGSSSSLLVGDDDNIHIERTDKVNELQSLSELEDVVVNK